MSDLEQVAGFRGEATQTVSSEALPIRLSRSGDSGTIGHYQVTGILGRGGMGVVYEAHDPTTGGVFALKMIDQSFLRLHDGDAAQRFAREIAVLEKLNHPGVVRFHGAGFANQANGQTQAYCVMERLHGMPLGEQLRTGRKFSVGEAVGIAGSVAEALAYLDARGVQHRDIKPSNIFIEDSGRVALMDFGLARSGDSTQLTRAGRIVGTIFYMSPERLCGLEADISSDLYALGVLMYELLIGRRPFIAADPNTLLRVIKKGLEWPDTFGLDELEISAKRLITRLLSPRGADRPSPFEVAERCRAIRELDEGLPADFTVAVTRVPLPAEGAHTKAVPRPQAYPAPVVESQRSGSVDLVRGPADTRSITHGMANRPTWLGAASAVVFASAISFAVGLLAGRRLLNRSAGTVQVAPTLVSPREVVPVRESPAPNTPPTTVTVRSVLPEFDSAKAAFEFGDAKLKENRPDVAVLALKEALELDPSDPAPYRRLGDAYLAKDKIAEALAAYQLFLDLDSQHEDAPRIRKLLRDFQP